MVKNTPSSLSCKKPRLISSFLNTKNNILLPVRIVNAVMNSVQISFTKTEGIKQKKILWDYKRHLFKFRKCFQMTAYMLKV